jgi:nicotinate-nucleotide adenylyltransferase
LPTSPRSFGGIDIPTPPAPRGRIVGLMGGSFNPPHVGHQLAAEEALQRLGLDELWWIVTPGNPLKSRGALKPLADRMAAVRAMAADPRMRVTAFEAALGSPYTAVTLQFLKRRYPGVRFVWVMGADNLATFHRWQDWRGIAAIMPMAIVDRPGFRFKALAARAAKSLEQSRIPETKARRLAWQKPPAWVFLTNPLSHQSSTAIRQGNDS